MNYGNLNKVCRVEIPEKTPNLSGGRKEKYIELLVCRCSLVKSSGKRVFENGWDNAVNTYKINTHWRQALQNEINVDLRFVIEERTFRMINWTLINEVRKCYEFEVEEIV